jgi:sugar/nucleoside kinase (ribokinase family)
MKRKRGFDVVCVGSATIDAFVKLPSDLKHIKPGSKVLIDEIDLLTGGGGTNVAVGLARLGLRAGFIGEIGDDLSAKMITHELKQENVRFLVNEHSRHNTAYSIILEAKGKDRSILVHKGASSYLHKHEIPGRLDTDWLVFGSMMGSSFDTMLMMARIAQKKKIDVYFNPSSYMVKQGEKFLDNAIKASRIIAMNKEEAQTLLKNKSRDKKTLLRGLHKLGPEICILTDGNKGTQVFDGKNFYSSSAKKIRPVDTTGAGDAFGAGFLAGWIMKKGLPQKQRVRFAMKLGVCNAESVIRHTGAKTGLLTKRKAIGLVRKR